MLSRLPIWIPEAVTGGYFQNFPYIRDPWDKPEYPCAVDWTHPLSRGLVGCWICNEGSGEELYDLVNTVSLSRKNGAVWTQTNEGINLLTDGYTEGAVAVAPSHLKLNAPISVIWKGNILGSVGIYAAFGGCLYDTAGNYPYWSYSIGSDAPGSYFVCWYNFGGTYVTVSSTTAISVGSWHITAVLKVNWQEIFVNGKFENTVERTISSLAYGTDPEIHIGSGTGQARTPNCTTSQLLIYDRALTASEIQQLYIEPYCFIRPTIYMPYWIVAAAAGGVPKHWDYYYRMRMN